MARPYCYKCDSPMRLEGKRWVCTNNDCRRYVPCSPNVKGKKDMKRKEYQNPFYDEELVK